MADAICRWRNPYINTVKQLIDLLPKIELPKTQARTIITSKSSNYFTADFYRAPYQLACQLGLYHETGGFYYPKFSTTPTEDTLTKYLENWIVHYTVPNPYTSQLPQNLQPFSIHAEICKLLIEAGDDLDWNNTLYRLFGVEIGNKDILRNAFIYSPVIEIRQNTIKLKSGITYENLIPFTNIDINTDRNNKAYFFDLFDIPQTLGFEDNSLPSDLLTSLTPEELDLLTTVQSSNQYTQTEKNQLIKARVGQGSFRRNLIADCPFCPITAIDDTNLLIASHIKPWRDSTNDERLDVKNGLLLSPTFDKLFDAGYISFRDDKTLLISDHISNANLNRLNISCNMEISNLPIEGRMHYFEYHRTEIFKG